MGRRLHAPLSQIIPDHGGRAYKVRDDLLDGGTGTERDYQGRFIDFQEAVRVLVHGDRLAREQLLVLGRVRRVLHEAGYRAPLRSQRGQEIAQGQHENVLCQGAAGVGPQALGHGSAGEGDDLLDAR